MTTSQWRGKSNHQLLLTDDEPARVQALLRLSAAEAEPSAQLRTRVLTRFEKRMACKNSAWMWLAPTTAAAVIVIVVLIAIGYSKLRAPQHPAPLPIVASKIPDLRLAMPAPQVRIEPTPALKAARTRSQHRPTDRLATKEPAATTESPIAQFDSLMYCDPFSCGDSMQVIRLEMPAASVGRAYRPLARNGFVSAEVIVGTDGLTRAVRFTK